MRPQPEFGGMTYHLALEIDRLSGVNGIDKALADSDFSQPGKVAAATNVGSSLVQVTSLPHGAGAAASERADSVTPFVSLFSP